MLSWIVRVRRVERLTSRGRDGGVGRNQQDVVERERFLYDAHYKPSPQNEIIQMAPDPDNREAIRDVYVSWFVDAQPVYR
jgi:hypothetical protein